VIERGWQLVAAARPGYAGSTRQEGRTVADVADDIAAVLDHLGLDRFLTIGRSGGGPHALACAALLPDRCDAAATIAGVAPYDAEGLDFLAGMGPENVEEYTAAATSRDDLQAFLDHEAAVMATVTGEQVAAALGGLVAEVDRNALTGDIAEGVAAGVRHAFTSGTAGWFDDDIAFVTPWGFDLAAITVPVSIWHGGDDRFVPPTHGEWLAAHVAGARAHLHADEGHISLVRRLPRILDDLVSRAGA
jgi:pimeloyl-ACP methyl ester carboxylesterase